jgi:hypothetical protein
LAPFPDLPFTKLIATAEGKEVGSRRRRRMMDAWARGVDDVGWVAVGREVINVEVLRSRHGGVE